jgi:O-antigen ligase
MLDDAAVLRLPAVSGAWPPVVGLLAALCLVALLIGVDPRLLGALFAGGLVSWGAVLSAEFGIAVIVAGVALFQRSELFELSVPFFGGGLKPTDILLLATLTGWSARVAAAAIGGKPSRRMPRTATVFVLAFVGWGIVCAGIGIARGAPYKMSLLELRPLLQYLLFLPIVTELDLGSVRRLAHVLLGVGVVVCVQALLLYAEGAGEEGTYTGGATRIMSVSFMLLLVSSMLCLALAAGGRRHRLWYAAAAALSLAALGVTFQRAAFLGLLVAFSIMFVLLDSVARYRLAFVGLAAAVALVVTATALADTSHSKPSIITALGQRIASIGEYDEDVSAQHRLEESKAAIKMIQQHPVVGNGLGTPVVFYSPMYDPERQRVGYLSTQAHIHNGYVWLWCKMGVVGVIAFLGIVTTVTAPATRAVRRVPDDVRVVLIGFLAILSAFVVVSFFGPMFTIDATGPIAVFVVASLSVLARSATR